MTSIPIALVGVGNCVSSLVQGLFYYANGGSNDELGLMHWDLAGYRPKDISVAAAFDIDARKVGKDVGEAIFAKPNNTAIFCDHVGKTGVNVSMGRVLDGVSEHMASHPEDRRFIVSDAPQPTKAEVVEQLKRSGAQVLCNYLPVGSQEATEFYADAAISAGLALVNNIPVFIASNPEWAKRFDDAGLPVIGDDIKAQLGATIVHRTLTDLFAKRGVQLDRTYQLNTGGNTDFLNMLNRDRLASKKESKTEAVQSVALQRLDDENIHVGPSDYVRLAERQQGLLPAHGRPHVRRRADEPGAAPVGRRQPEQRRCRHRHDPLRPRRAGSQARRPGAGALVLFLQAPAGADHR